MDNLVNIARQFVYLDKIIKVEKLGNGNINRTFLVTIDRETKPHFVLQQINTEVFERPALVMDNIVTFTNHIDRKLNSLSPQDSLYNYPYWQIPQVIFTTNNKHHYLDNNGGFWRAISFIENSQTFNTVQNLEHSEEVGRGLGIFHTLISDLDTTKLADTLPGFHITPEYLNQYYRVVNKTNVRESAEAKYCQNFIAERTDFINVLEKAKEQGILKLRPIHGDPKINNITIDRDSNKAVAMVDLDTIKPGLIHYDIGDCLRSGCNILGEETQDWEKVSFDLTSAQNILQGYLSIAKDFITQQELNYIYDGVRLIAFELGLRFFTDYINGNVYFKTDYPKHNLIRALVQFQLTKSIESQAKEIKCLIA